MDYLRKIAGWDKAAKKYLAGLPQCTVTVPRITPEQAAEMAASQQRALQQKKIVTVTSNLVGREFGILRAWERGPVPSTGAPPEWVCLCGCGNWEYVSASLLIRGRKKHCGCRKTNREAVAKHRRKMARINRDNWL
jgi:hypothetical protein